MGEISKSFFGARFITQPLVYFSRALLGCLGDYSLVAKEEKAAVKHKTHGLQSVSLIMIIVLFRKCGIDMVSIFKITYRPISMLCYAICHCG